MDRDEEQLISDNTENEVSTQETKIEQPTKLPLIVLEPAVLFLFLSYSLSGKNSSLKTMIV